MIEGFGIVWSERGLLLDGLTTTVVISVIAALLALVLGALLAAALGAPQRGLARAARVWIDAMRCTPFLLFAYLIYYGLPSLGVRLDNEVAGVAALALYHAAYLGELLYAAWLAQPRAPIEAGLACGFSGLDLYRRIVLPPLLLALAPVVGNQAIQVVKDSAFLTIIALPELTHAASSIQSRHYVPFAAFLSAVLLYWAICLVVEAGVAQVGRLAEARR